MTTAIHPPAAPRSAIDGVGVRVLMLGWCLWLLGSWAVTLTLDSPILAVRWMVFAAFIGLTVIWPVVRLSQDAGPRPTAATLFLDWFCLLLIFQAVIGSLSLVARWSLQQTLWLDAAMASWSLLIGAVAAIGRRFDHAAARMAAMTLCLMLLLGLPVARLIAGRGAPAGWPLAESGLDSWTGGLQPLAVLWELTQRSIDVHLPSVAAATIAAAIAAVAAWAGVLAVSRLQRREHAGR